MKKIKISDLLKLDSDKLYEVCNTKHLMRSEDKLILSACGIILVKIYNRPIRDLMMFTYLFISTARDKNNEMNIWYNKSTKSVPKGPIPLENFIRYPFTRRKCKDWINIIELLEKE